ncbi:MAG: hypothetical protein WAN50_04790 [Minisyncoccia bacterium]
MGERIVGNWRIFAATLLSVGLVVGAYLLAKGVASPPIAQASTETALLQQIASKDSNGDGLPDWEKTLYGIPLNSTTTDYFHLGMTDGQAVAQGMVVPKAIADVPVATSSAETGTPDAPAAAPEGTLTDTFAKSFLTLYIAAKNANNGADLTQDQINTVEQQALSGLESSVASAPDFKSSSDLVVSGSGPDALKNFAVLAEGVLAKNDSHLPKSALAYLQDAMNGDATALDSVAKKAKAFRDSAAGLSALPVPKELLSEDLQIINAAARIGEISSDFAEVNTDPLATMLALGQYEGAVSALVRAFSDMDDEYAAEGVTIENGEPGASIVNFEQNLEEASTTATP